MAQLIRKSLCARISSFGCHFGLPLIIGIAPRYTTCDFATVECRRFVVGILIIIIYVIVSEILLLPVTASGSILDFRHEVASAMIAGDLDVSFIDINPCIVFRTTCVSVKPAKLLVLPVIWPPSWISGAHRRPTKSEVPPLESLTPKT